MAHAAAFRHAHDYGGSAAPANIIDTGHEVEPLGKAGKPPDLGFTVSYDPGIDLVTFGMFQIEFGVSRHVLGLEHPGPRSLPLSHPPPRNPLWQMPQKMTYKGRCR